VDVLNEKYEKGVPRIHPQQVEFVPQKSKPGVFYNKWIEPPRPTYDFVVM
jgi:hypothetical protein